MLVPAGSLARVVETTVPEAVGKIEAGTPTFIQNAGFVWLLLLVPLAFLGWFGMNNLLTVSPRMGSTAAALGRIVLLYRERDKEPEIQLPR